MGRITFILGGARSGKSSFAIESAERCGKRVAFVATCAPLDDEMKRRIALHKKKRPPRWTTFEPEEDIASLVKKIGFRFDVIIIDCLTLFIAGLLLKRSDEKAVEAVVSRMIKSLKETKNKSFIVSNEVGLGIVPRNKLGRDFRDLAGRINQLVAREADQVVFMVSGLPQKIK